MFGSSCCCCCCLHSRPAHVFKFIDCSAHKTRRLCFVHSTHSRSCLPQSLSPLPCSLTVPHGDVLLCSMGDVRVVVLCYIFRHLVCPAYATYVALCNLRHNLQLATRRRALAQAVGLRKVQLGAFINLCAFRLP